MTDPKKTETEATNEEAKKEGELDEKALDGVSGAGIHLNHGLPHAKVPGVPDLSAPIKDIVNGGKIV